MSVADAAKFAREHADVCLDKGCHAVANALEAAVRAEADAALHDALHEPADLAGIPDSPVKSVLIPRPERQN